MRRRWSALAAALDRHPGLVVAAAATAAAALTLLVTRDGMLLDGDTGSYLRGAQLLVDGRAGPFSLPIDDATVNAGRFPPGYAWALALVGADLDAARYLNAALAAVTLGAITALVARHTRAATAAVTALVLLTARGVVGRLFGFVVAEPLAMAGVWLAVLLVDAAITTRDRRRATALAVGAGIAVALGAAARNPIMAVVAALAVSIVVRCHGRRRLLAVPVAGIGSSLWLIWFVTTRDPTAVGRHQLGWTWFFDYDFGTATDTLASVWLPGPVALSMPGAIAGVAVLVAVGATGPWLVTTARATRRSDRPGGPVTMVLLVLWAQVVALVGARLWVDSYISFEARHVLPVLVALVVALALATAGPEPLLPRWLQRAVGPAAFVAAVSGTLILVSSFRDPIEQWANINEQVEDSGLLAVGRTLPADTPVFSNRTDLVLIGMGREAEGVPVGLDAGSVATLVDALEPGATVLLFTDDLLWAPDPDELVDVTGLTVVDRQPDGLVLVCGDGCRAS